MLALIQTSGLVDPHTATKVGGLYLLLQLCGQITLSVSRATWPRRAFRTHVMTYKNMVLKNRQLKFPPLPA